MSEVSELTPHEANYNLIAAAIATAAATMLTLLTTLGTVDIVSRSSLLKGLLEAELLVIEFSLIVSVIALAAEGPGREEEAGPWRGLPSYLRDPAPLAKRYDNNLRLGLSE